MLTKGRLTGTDAELAETFPVALGFEEARKLPANTIMVVCSEN